VNGVSFGSAIMCGLNSGKIGLYARTVVYPPYFGHSCLGKKKSNNDKKVDFVFHKKWIKMFVFVLIGGSNFFVFFGQPDLLNLFW
jgi:hypothetical protein